MRPSRDYTSSIRFHLIRKIPPVREDSTRSEGVDSFRSGVSPHRQQASSRNSPTRPLCQRGPPRFVATPAVNTVPDAQQGLAGQPCASEGACTRGNGGGFAPLEASCRRVAGVSRLYWCNSPRLLAPSTWGEPDRAPLMAQFPPVMSGHEERRTQTAAPRRLAPRSTPKPPPPRHNGGFCTIRSILPACHRRVAPLMLQFPPFAGSEIAVRGGEDAVRGGEVAVRGGEEPTSQTTSTKNADNGPSWARRPALWTQGCLASRVARARTRYYEC